MKKITYRHINKQCFFNHAKDFGYKLIKDITPIYNEFIKFQLNLEIPESEINERLDVLLDDYLLNENIKKGEYIYYYKEPLDEYDYRENTKLKSKKITEILKSEILLNTETIETLFTNGRYKFYNSELDLKDDILNKHGIKNKDEYIYKISVEPIRIINKYTKSNTYEFILITPDDNNLLTCF